jgi:hypothetical protein
MTSRIVTRSASKLNGYDNPSKVNYYLHRKFKCIQPYETAQIGDVMDVNLAAFGLIAFAHVDKNARGCSFDMGPNVDKTIAKFFKRIEYELL